jgi:tetratricopeptide (TPR) repeat protein
VDIYQKLNNDKDAQEDFKQAFKLNSSIDVPVEKDNIPPQPVVTESKDSQAQQAAQPAQETVQIKPETPLDTSNIQPSPQAVIPKPKNSQETMPQTSTATIENKTETTREPAASNAQNTSEQNIANPITQITPQENLQPQQAEAQVVSNNVQAPTTENLKEESKKQGFSSKLFKKGKKENIDDNNEISTPTPSVHPSDVETMYNRANMNYKNKKYSIALDDLSKILSRETNYVKGYLLRANVYADSGDNNKALEDLNKTIELSPSSFLAYFKRPEIYSLQNNDDAALADFGKTTELNQKFGSGYVGIAKIYVKRGDKEKAIKNYNLAKKYDIKYSKIADTEIKALSIASS